MEKATVYKQHLDRLLSAGLIQLSDQLPSEWAEANRVMTADVSSRQGAFSYRYTPYLREVVDCLSPNNPAKIISVMKGAQVGFALDAETEIPTVNGFKKMADISIGEIVFDENGERCEVVKATEIMHGHKCYDVTFSDGSVIRCDAEHLWTVWDEKKWETRKLVTIDTDEISKTFRHRSNRNRYAIDVCSPVDYPEKQLPIDPYILGLWLGDGHTKGNRLTCHIDDLADYLEQFEKIGESVKVVKKGNIATVQFRKQDGECARGHKYDKPKIAGSNVCRICSTDRYHNRQSEILTKRFGERLVKMGLYGNKHIPDEYLFSSVDQRLSLLQGLIDTDGHVAKNSHVEFYNVNKELILQVKALVESLGFKVRMRVRLSKGMQVIIEKPVNKQDLWVLDFKAWKERPVARLKRKANRLLPLMKMRNSEITRRRIVNVQEVESVPVKCISVSSKSNLFLASSSMIATHNSTGVIETGIGWIISQSPSNILFLTGHADLAEEAMSGKIDNLIQNSGIRHLIRSNSGRLRNMKTGDTNKAKEFPNGSLVAGAVGNHKLLRQRSVRYGFIDDFDAAKALSKESGATRKMVEQRFAAYASTKKIFYISTPELMETSNIHPVYIMGDQRKYHIPCPCCSELIRIEWEIPIDGGEGEMGGITWQLDDRGKLIKDSVGYTCYKCGGWFDDSGKSEWLLDEKEGGRAKWVPTSEAFNEDYRSYHLSSLYAPAGMDGWAHYVANWLEANPKGQLPISAHMQTFTNLCLGLPWEDTGEKPQANQLQQNTRNYRPWTIPDVLSEKDGNGKIVLLTMAIDLNGKVEDARADWEVVGWSESGASYSIAHGSIGTFIPKEKEIGERVRWTYDHNRPRSVWPEIEKIMATALGRDKGDKKMRIHVAGIDAPSHFAEHAYKYVDASNYNVFALKGDGERNTGPKQDVTIFKRSIARPKLYILDVNTIKDQLAQNMKLTHLLGSEDAQPVGFMNYPLPEMGMYTYSDFFSHYEAEERRIERSVNGSVKGMRWVKRSSTVQNHFWDCRVYNMALKEIFVSEVGRAAKVKDFTWKDWCDTVLNRKG